jgi:hypothetical protein
MLFLTLLGAAKLDPQPNVVWADVVATEGCFFFSGPQQLGRDTDLGSMASFTADRTALSFGSVRFTGDEGTYTRTQTHRFGGPWVIEETIAGHWEEGVFVGVYAYREREATATAWGRCRIDARLAVKPR